MALKRGSGNAGAPIGGAASVKAGLQPASLQVTVMLLCDEDDDSVWSATFEDVFRPDVGWWIGVLDGVALFRPHAGVMALTPLGAFFSSAYNEGTEVAAFDRLDGKLAEAPVEQVLRQLFAGGDGPAGIRIVVP
jgi:hypothetical protein